MKNRLKFITGFILVFLFTQISIAQSNIDSDRAAIEATVKMYFDGWLEGDTTKLGQAMHSSCQLKNVKDGGCKEYDRKMYLSFFKPRERLKDAGGEILSIDITNNIAAVKCQLTSPNKVFTDYFNMMTFNGDQWYIVDKISTNRLRTDADQVPK